MVSSSPASSPAKTPDTRDSSLPTPERRSNNHLSWSRWLWHRTFEDCCTRCDDDVDEKAPQPVSLLRFLSFSLSKLLLEVCGAAGAVWGFSEILEWRRVENTDDFRGIVTIAFVAFAGRWYLHVKHFWQHGYDYDFPYEYAKLHHQRSCSCLHWYHGLQVFGAKFVLQVCGAAGAVWGASETTGLRHPLNRDSWQTAAWGTTVIFGIRWLIELSSYCLLCRRRIQRQRGRWYNVLKKDVVPFVEVTITKFVLEVCGSSGAVWGFADILTIRDQTPDSATGWRITALVIGTIFLVRWILHVKEYLCSGQESPLVTEPPRVELPHVQTTSTSSSSFESEEEYGYDEETRMIPGQQVNYTYYYGSTTTEVTPLDSDHNVVV